MRSNQLSYTALNEAARTDLMIATGPSFMSPHRNRSGDLVLTKNALYH